VLATGHQPWFWHPGILAKDLALQAGSERLSAAAFHLVVDHDPVAALHLELPGNEAGRLTVQTRTLAPHRQPIPPGYHPSVDPETLARSLARDPAEQVGPFREALADLPACRTLAEQVAAGLARLKAPHLGGHQPLLLVSDFPRLRAYRALVERMRVDAPACAAAYNRAVLAEPAAGVPPLAVTREWVELPLWACGWNRPRRRVYADVSDEPVLLVLGDGTPVGEAGLTLLPRALALSAFVRGYLIDFFIHGQGGGVYDRLTDAWWAGWLGGGLSPTAVVSADAYLSFDAPVADRGEVSAAKWHRDHIDDNVDRVLGLAGPLPREKARLVAQNARDRRREPRRLRFRAIRRINAELNRQHAEAIAEADRRLRRARLGLANRAVAYKRDWPFPLYPAATLASLRRELTGG